MNNDIFQRRRDLLKERAELDRQEQELDRLGNQGSSYDTDGNEQNEDDNPELEDNLDVEDSDENPEEENQEEEESEEETEDDTEEESEEDEEESDEESEEDEEESDEESDDDKEDSDKDGDSKSDSQKRKDLGPNKKDDSDDSKDSNPADKAKDAAADKVSEALGDKDGNVAKVQNAANKATAVANAVTNAVSGIVSLLTNPVFWIIVAIALIVASLSSTVSVVGGNDYNKACDMNGVGSVNVAGDADALTRQSAIASWLMSTPFEVLGGKPMTREQAIGVLGNLIEESYGANPKAVQGDHTLTKWQTCDNNCVAAFNGGGLAVGILQWDGASGDPRRSNLVKLAQQEGKQWYDLDVQLKHIKNELDGIGSHTYENSQIKKSGFLDPGKTVEEYTTLWAEYIERCGKCRMDDRIKSANDFNAKFQGGGSVGSLSTQCVGGAGSIDASSLVQLALQISYTREEKAQGLGYGVCQNLINCGQSFSKPEYIEAKKQAEATTSADPSPGLTASCDRMAATLIRLTGMDTNFPWGGASIQMNYMIENPGWTEVSCQERQAGDVIARDGHIMVYIGMIDGRDTIASASIALASRVGPGGQGRAAHLSDLTCKGDSWYADGNTARAWRKIN